MATPGQALDEFRGLIGVTERPLGSNNAPPVTDWSGMQDKWCAMACSYVLSRVGIPLRIWLCQSIMDMARASQGGWSWTTTEPQPGDLVLFQWDTGPSDHIGMVESVRPDAIVAIEGNYQDKCARVVRKRGGSILGYARPPYSGQASASTSTSPGVPDFPGTTRQGYRSDAVHQVQQRLADRGWKLDVNSLFGPDTARVVRSFQKDKGLTIDGIVGPKTWHALWAAPVT